MNQYRPSKFKLLPDIIKNLLIINGLFFLATVSLDNALGFDLSNLLGLHYFKAEDFEIYQIVSYMFMHGNLTHIAFNMFALWMFGNSLENFWGAKRFLIYYMITGIGAGLIQLLVTHIRLEQLYAQISPEALNTVLEEGHIALKNSQNFTDPLLAKVNLLINTPTVGASGSVFGMLLAFGMLFPNTMLYVYFAIPIKAKWFVLIYGIIELYSGIANNPTDNVAHFAHLGGMLFGYFLIKYWKTRRGNQQYNR